MTDDYDYWLQQRQSRKISKREFDALVGDGINTDGSSTYSTSMARACQHCRDVGPEAGSGDGRVVRKKLSQ